MPDSRAHRYDTLSRRGKLSNSHSDRGPAGKVGLYLPRDMKNRIVVDFSKDELPMVAEGSRRVRFVQYVLKRMHTRIVIRKYLFKNQRVGQDQPTDSADSQTLLGRKLSGHVWFLSRPQPRPRYRPIRVYRAPRPFAVRWLGRHRQR